MTKPMFNKFNRQEYLLIFNMIHRNSNFFASELFGFELFINKERFSDLANYLSL